MRKYSQDREEFMRKFVVDLVANGLAYANPTSNWACAPLLVPKIGGPYQFTIEIWPVNIFKIMHLFPMPNLDNEITNVKSSKYFAIFTCIMDIGNSFQSSCLKNISLSSNLFVSTLQ